jgi:hypothetical protein
VIESWDRGLWIVGCGKGKLTLRLAVRLARASWCTIGVSERLPWRVGVSRVLNVCDDLESDQGVRER